MKTLTKVILTSLALLGLFIVWLVIDPANFWFVYALFGGSVLGIV